MLKLQLMTEKDRREAAYIERRRIQEEERKKRLFNPRQRLIGIDTQALQAQIEEKKKKELEVKRNDSIFENELKKADQIAITLEQKQREEQKKLQKEIETFRKNFQKPEDRREFDLNDPNGIKKQLPCRLHDDDPRLGPSSAQKFEGEDLSNEERLKLQKVQIKAWLGQQLIEREQAEKERKMAEDAYKDVSQSNMGPGKKIAYLYKGMSEEEKLQIRREQISQIEEARSKMLLMYLYMFKKKKEMEARMQREFEAYINGTQQTIHLMDLELKRKHREELKKIADENLRLAEEQKSRKKFLNTIVYVNRATEDYFDQFNKSSR
ncbi:hypothetical protein HUJ04_008193 [Dendroctonus ponderosae]|nr:hypothetical protein HUJ04_008193 [Dendroctonus ponderosae]